MQSIPQSLDHEIIMLITYTGRVLWWYQTSHHKRVTIKVELGTPKVLVEDHGSRVELVHPNDGEIYSGLSWRYYIDTAYKHVTRSQGCHVMERVKSICQVTRSNKVYLIPMNESRTSKISWDKGIRIWCLWFIRSQDLSLNMWESLRISRSRWWLLIGEMYLDHVHIICEP
jgi:hypothetical protein